MLRAASRQLFTAQTEEQERQKLSFAASLLSGVMKAELSTPTISAQTDRQLQRVTALL